MGMGMTGRTVKAICPDGVVRTATITGEADSAFTAPARVTAKGVTVTGFVTGKDLNDPDEWPQHLFHENRNGRNAAVFAGQRLPRWHDQCGLRWVSKDPTLPAGYQESCAGIRAGHVDRPTDGRTPAHRFAETVTLVRL